METLKPIIEFNEKDRYRTAAAGWIIIGFVATASFLLGKRSGRKGSTN